MKRIVGNGQRHVLAEVALTAVIAVGIGLVGTASAVAEDKHHDAKKVEKQVRKAEKHAQKHAQVERYYNQRRYNEWHGNSDWQGYNRHPGAGYGNAYVYSDPYYAYAPPPVAYDYGYPSPGLSLSFSF